MFRAGLVLAVSLSAATASAQQWAEKMFDVRSHDFGAVPKAAKIEYAFTLKNLYKDDVHIASVRSSCGCTQPRIVNDTLKSHEEGQIVAAFNTSAFSGQRGATVTVTIDRPQYAEVRLDVKGYIRTDVVVHPGQVNFGSVAEGRDTQKKVRIEYAGRNNWAITDVKTNSPFITAKANEIARSPGRVSYELAVELKPDAPAGYLQDELQLITNDRRRVFPVSVEGRVVSELSVSPSPLMLGTVQPGQTITKQIVVKGLEPFKILEVRCASKGFTFKTSDEAKTAHLIPVTFDSSSTTGKISEKIEIVTDLGDRKTVELTVTGQVNEPLAGN